MEKEKEIRIQNVSPDLWKDLKNIAKNIGIPLAAFLKPKLREIADSYSENMKQAPSKH